MNRVLLCDTVEDRIPRSGTVVLWDGPAREAGSISLTRYLDSRADEIRRRYLAWVHDLGGRRLLGRPLHAHFATRTGSLWALSPFVERSTWKQPSLEKILKVLAFEMLLRERGTTCVRYAGSDRALNRTLRALCRQLSVSYDWLRMPGPGSRRSFLARAIPSIVRGLAALGYLYVTRLRLPRACEREQTSARRVLICAPFFNHNADERRGSDFTSQYWATLPRMLVESGRELCWLHLYYPHAQVPNARAAARTVQRIREESDWSGEHCFVEAYLTLAGMVALAARWCVIAVEGWLVGLALSLRFADAPRESYWPLIRADWANAFHGPRAAVAIFYSACFDRALRSLAHCEEGIYLMEGQEWERALARAWHSHAHGRLAAVAHSTIRFWDLRYHCDPRQYADPCRERDAEPDVVVMNGVVEREMYLATSATREELVDCEALRYLHVLACPPRPLQRGETVSLLVLGDFLPDSTRALLELVRAAVQRAAVRTTVMVKPHPNCPVAAFDGWSSAPVLVDGRVSELASRAHLAVASNTTSAALDAYLGGCRVAVFDNLRGVNFSPLRGVSGAAFVHDPAQLGELIGDLAAGKRSLQPRAGEFFSIDPTLPRWRRYFGLTALQCAPARACVSACADSAASPRG